MNLGSKKYVYNEAGKLTSVEKSSFATEIGTYTQKIDLEKKRTEGMARYAEKQAEKAKIEAEKAQKLELERKMKPTVSELAGTERNIDADYVDRSFNYYDGQAERYVDYRKLTREYEKLEQNDVVNKENVAKLKKHLHKPTETNS